MAEYITKEQAIECIEFYQINPQHFDFVSLIDDIKGETQADVVERSFLIQMLEEFIKATNVQDVYSCGMRNAFRVVLNSVSEKKIQEMEECPDYVERSKIDKAIEEIENINPVCSTIGDIIPVLKNCDDIKAEVLDIIKKIIGE